MSDNMTEIKEFKQVLTTVTEQLEADGHYELSIALNLFGGSLITTIESQKEEIESLKNELAEQQEISHGFHQLANKYHYQLQEGEK